MIDQARLACLLLSYEADEPHVSLPGCDVGGEQDQCYPTITVEELARWLADEHCGDCVNQPGPCPRCAAEQAVHKARWLIERMQ